MPEGGKLDLSNPVVRVILDYAVLTTGHRYIANATTVSYAGG